MIIVPPLPSGRGGQGVRAVPYRHSPCSENPAQKKGADQPSRPRISSWAARRAAAGRSPWARRS